MDRFTSWGVRSLPPERLKSGAKSDESNLDFGFSPWDTIRSTTIQSALQSGIANDATCNKLTYGIDRSSNMVCLMYSCAQPATELILNRSFRAITVTVESTSD
jgi:hypothetical protein